MSPTRFGCRMPSSLRMTQALGVVVLLGHASGQPAMAQPAVTFAKDVAPILQKNCQQCHQSGAVGPMSLTTFEEVRPWARAIKQKVVAGGDAALSLRRDVGIQKLKHDLRLSEAEIQTIARWVDSGAPLGNPADLPPPLEVSGSQASGRSRTSSVRRMSWSAQSRSPFRPRGRTSGGGRSCRRA